MKQQNMLIKTSDRKYTLFKLRLHDLKKFKICLKFTFSKTSRLVKNKILYYIRISQMFY